VRQNYKLQIIIFSLGTLIFSATAAGIFDNFEFIVVDLLEKDLGGNGRDELWGYLIQRALEKPWLGYGYCGFWFNPVEVYGVIRNTWFGGELNGDTNRILYSAAALGTGHAHNGYIDLFLSLGIVGLALFALSFICILWGVAKLIRSSKTTESLWMLMYLIFMALLNLTITGTLLDPQHLFWILYVSISCSVGVQNERISNRNKSEEIKSSHLLSKRLEV
jgi:exopolysaccharide production protein ExoQ